MVNLSGFHIIVYFIVTDVALSNLLNGITEVKNAVDNNVKNESMKIAPKVKTRRKSKKDRSTSSSSGDISESKDSVHGESLSMSSYSSLSSESKEKKKKHSEPKSTEERHGWRKWHRKCPRCGEEMKLKWRDPRIQWICGAYQQARRSFKSLCMMHYRNCQDGTMFMKIADHRCDNDTDNAYAHRGEHFFYDYPVRLRDESDDSDSSSRTLETSSGTFE